MHIRVVGSSPSPTALEADFRVCIALSACEMLINVAKNSAIPLRHGVHNSRFNMSCPAKHCRLRWSLNWIAGLRYYSKCPTIIVGSADSTVRCHGCSSVTLSNAFTCPAQTAESVTSGWIYLHISVIKYAAGQLVGELKRVKLVSTRTRLDVHCDIMS